MGGGTDDFAIFSGVASQMSNIRKSLLQPINAVNKGCEPYLAVGREARPRQKFLLQPINAVNKCCGLHFAVGREARPRQKISSATN
jgi:hypothetical protein